MNAAPVQTVSSASAPGSAGSLAARFANEAPPTTAQIDSSCRTPLLFLFLTGAVWLLAAVVLLLIASIKLHGPGFLANIPFLTLGRIRPAAMNALLYGFASPAAIGLMLWLFCRLGRNRLVFQPVALIASWFWNIGVLVGFVSILRGGSTGFEWLEFPRVSVPFLFFSYLLIGICAVVTFHRRNERTLYVSQWYLLAALFWFPWIYSAATMLLLFQPVRGVVQAVVNAWFTNNLLWLWLSPVALAMIYYFIPKLLKRQLFNYWLALLGFWLLAFLTNWTGLTQLAGGPLPRWMYSVSAGASLMLIMPLTCIGLNWCHTYGVRALAGPFQRHEQPAEDLTLRYILFAGLCFFVAAGEGIIIGFPEVSRWTQFTYMIPARIYLALFGFVGMTFFAAIYYLAPRITLIEWPSAKWVRLHLKLTAGGIVIIYLALTVGGLIQGFKWNNPASSPVSVVRSTLPLVGLSTLGFLALLVGQALFLGNLVRLCHRYYEPLRASTRAVLTGPEVKGAL
jgi:cytochrome c oxidase cbb3-type subunit 1